MLCRALVAAAEARKLFSRCLARRAMGPQPTVQAMKLIPWQLSSKTIEAYKPLEIDKVVSNVICKIQFPWAKLRDIPS